MARKIARLELDRKSVEYCCLEGIRRQGTRDVVYIETETAESVVSDSRRDTSAVREWHTRETAGSRQEEGLCTTEIILIKCVFLFCSRFVWLSGGVWGTMCGTTSVS